MVSWAVVMLVIFLVPRDTKIPVYILGLWPGSASLRPRHSFSDDT
jgi:hypothetical protein